MVDIKTMADRVKDTIYRIDFTRELAGDDKFPVDFSNKSRVMYYCAKCKGRYKIVEVKKDQIEDGFREREIIAKCVECGDEVEMGITVPCAK